MIERLMHGLLKGETRALEARMEARLLDAMAVSRFALTYGEMLGQSVVPDHFVSYSYPTAFWHGWGVNLGDYVQTIATEHAVRKAVGEDVRFETVRRDRLVRHNGGRCVMQGWYENGTLDFFPGPNTCATWVGTHFCDEIRPRIALLWKEDTSMVPREIGCRDLSTLDFCRMMGVSAYFSRCLTLTLPRREERVDVGNVYLVDCPDWLVARLPEELVRDAVTVTQRRYQPKRDEALRQTTEEILARYRKDARLVVTTALHCAQPCIAMGIPVVLIDPDGGGADRFSALKGILHKYDRQDLEKGRVDFSPKPIDIEPLKRLLLRNLQLSLCSKLTQEETAECNRIRRDIANFSVL